jgi:hypothetical protein
MDSQEESSTKQEVCRAITESFVSERPRARFTFSDITSQRTMFYERLEQETDSIYNSPRARKGRSRHSVRDSSFRGLVAEAWYVQTQPFPGSVSWTDLRWHDVVVNESSFPTFKNAHIEVKTLSEWNHKEVFTKIDSIVWAKWNTSAFVAMFLTNWDKERDMWFNEHKSRGEAGTFVSQVESGSVEVWWEYFGTKCIDPTKDIPNKQQLGDIYKKRII